MKKIFLDTNILIKIFRGDPEEKILLSKESLKKVQYFISNLVIQELLLVGKKNNEINKFKINQIDKYFKVIELTPGDIEDLPPNLIKLKKLRNELVHKSFSLSLIDYFNLVLSQKYCDFLVTDDYRLIKTSKEILDDVKALTLKEFKNKILQEE